MTKLLTAWLTLQSNQYRFHFSNFDGEEFKDIEDFYTKSYVILTRRKKNNNIFIFGTCATLVSSITYARGKKKWSEKNISLVMCLLNVYYWIILSKNYWLQ